MNGSKCHGWFPQYVVPPVERYEDSEKKAEKRYSQEDHWEMEERWTH